MRSAHTYPLERVETKWLFHVEYTGDIESQVNFSFPPLTYCLRDKSLLYHGRTITEMELEYVSTGFDIKSKADGAVESFSKLVWKYMDILCIE